MIVRICVTIYFKRLIWLTTWSMSWTNKTFDAARPCPRAATNRGTPNPVAVPAESRRARCHGVPGRALRLVNFYGLSGNLERRRTTRGGRAVYGDDDRWNSADSNPPMPRGLKLRMLANATFKSYALKVKTRLLFQNYYIIIAYLTVTPMHLPRVLLFVVAVVVS